MKKKTGKRILSFLMAVIMVIGTLYVPGLTLEVHATTVVASGSCGTNVIWELDDAGKLTIRGNGEITSTPWLDQGYTDDIKTLVIEDGEGNEVTNIPNQAFIDCENLTGVTIPGSVKTIGNSAFYNCGMSTVVLPEGVESIDPGAFYGCKKLESISIPKTVTNIRRGAFNLCDALEAINVDSNNTMFCSVDGVLYNIGKTSLLRYPGGKEFDSKYLNTVTDIGAEAFYGYKKLTEITIPANVTSLGREAFCECTSLASVTLPAGLSDIGSLVFWGCTALTNITIPGGLWTTGSGTFRDCSALTSVVIEEGVEMISDNAFNGCSSLTEITIPKSLYSIKVDAFKDCNKTIAVKYYGTAAEWNDISLAEGCGLDNYTLSCLGVDRVASGTCGDGMSWNLDSTGQLTISGSGEVSSAPWKDEHREAIKKVVIGKNVTDITKAELMDCDNLEEISVEAGNAAYISEEGILFNNDKTKLIQYPCKKAESKYSIPDSVKFIGDYAFTRCNNLTDITIPFGVETISDAAFSRCEKLSGISIPESVTDIGVAAFDRCKKISEICLPKEYTEIKDITFRGCISLNTIIFTGTVTAIGENAFQNCNALKDVYYPGRYYDLYWKCQNNGNDCLIDATFHPMKGYCGYFTTWTLTMDGLLTISGNDEISIDQEEIWYPDDVVQLVIEEGVPEIGYSAFEDNSRLTSVYLPLSVKSILSDAFNGCTSLTDVYYSGTEEDWKKINIQGSGNDLLLGADIHFKVLVTGVNLSSETLSLKVGESGTLTATVAPANATNKKVSWASSAEAVATVADGVVTAVAEGEATITVTTEDGGKTASCKVTVTKVEEPAEPDKPEEPVMVEGPLGPEKPDLSRYTASGNEIAAKSINLKKT
ncbi:MAG: leucine-rich repeat protein, partial [Lachnospiraceae bacterium]|nr:leucine-rich repeat protein [Lachnospiraceae bacterium]